MIRIFPDFSVQVSASSAGSGGGGLGGGSAGGGMLSPGAGPPLGRVPVVPGAGTGAQSAQGLGAYQKTEYSLNSCVSKTLSDGYNAA
uniref:Uncharacterized protein n=1 Tax=Knipowitschia caucasica TaxID=637954 RepID=A0AAV2JHZ8_KNICA